MEREIYQIPFGQENLTIAFNNLAEQANGSVVVNWGETCVIANVVMSKNDRPELNFFPLLVDYEEKYYAAGKIYGSRFVRRESRPSTVAILTGRLIDRTIRPLFPDNLQREVQVVVTCLSFDNSHDPDVIGIIAASLALGVSDIPWLGPVSAVRVGWSLEQGFLFNPTYEEREKLALELVVSGPENKINMLEGGAQEVKEEIVKEAFRLAQQEIFTLNQAQESIIKIMGREKIKIVNEEQNSELQADIEKFVKLYKVEEYLFTGQEKQKASSHQLSIDDLFKNYLVEKNYSDDQIKKARNLLEEKINSIIHQNIIQNERRPDGRKLDEIRPIEAAIDVLARVHGSAIFMRGLTHALSIVTLGSPADNLFLQGMEVTGRKRFMHHYNFPGYSTGEVSASRGPGRREIGHGALGERSLEVVLPPEEEFPYTIRVVSEIMSSNGSTSMAATCASSLALMAAGVPIKSHVAGVAIGLMSELDPTSEAGLRYKIITDIQGPEDHYGDMDFKVTGTEKGVAAIQMDMKIKGVVASVLEEALDRSKAARLIILEKMNQVIDKPRPELSPYAPRIFTLKIKPEKIGELIGPGGKVIQGISQNFDVQIDIQDDGTIFVTAPDKTKGEAALAEIKAITKDFIEGEIVQGKITQIKEFGAIVDLGHRHEGLLHISELAPYRVNRVEDIVRSGDMVKVKIKKVDDSGKISLSLKDADLDSNKPSFQSKRPVNRSYPKRKFSPKNY